MSVPEIATAVLDASLDYFKTHCTKVVACLTEPANYADANTISGSGTGKKLAEATVSAADFVTQNGANPVLRESAFGGKTGDGLVVGDPTVICYLDTTNGVILQKSPENGIGTVQVGTGNINFPAAKVYQHKAPVTNP